MENRSYHSDTKHNRYHFRENANKFDKIELPDKGTETIGMENCDNPRKDNQFFHLIKRLTTKFILNHAQQISKIITLLILSFVLRYFIEEIFECVLHWAGRWSKCYLEYQNLMCPNERPACQALALCLEVEAKLFPIIKG